MNTSKNEKCFSYGKHQVRVIEHFAKSGKTLSQLIAELVLQEARKSEEKLA